MKFPLSALLTAFTLASLAHAAEPYQIAVIPKGTTHEYWKAVQAGDISALMVQDPFRLGYLGVNNAVAVLRGEPVDKFVDTGVTVATRENLDQPAVRDLVNPPLDEYLK